MTGSSESHHFSAEDGIRLFVERIGAGGRTLVILNGFYLLEDFAQLSDDRAVIGLDLRNRGRSEWVQDASKLARGVLQDVDDIEAMRKHLGIGRIDLLAHSYAGVVGLLYAMRYPARVGRMVMVSPLQPDPDAQYPPELTNHDRGLEQFVEAAGKLQERRQGHSSEDFCREFWVLLRSLYVVDPADARKLGHWERCGLETERHFMSYWSQALLPSIQQLAFGPAEVASVTMPVLVVHGTKDRSAPYGGGRQWAGLLPNARLLTVEDVAHAPWIEKPGQVFGPIRTFLDGMWPQRAGKIEGI